MLKLRQPPKEVREYLKEGETFVKYNKQKGIIKILNKITKIVDSNMMNFCIIPITIINYFIIILVMAVNYDVENELSGGPATMVIGLAIGPVVAIILSLITYHVVNYLAKKTRRRVQRIIILIHLLFFTVIFFSASYMYVSEVLVN